LRKEGKLRPRVQGQPLDVLLHLLAHRGDVVSRDELRVLLWPKDTYVDYDHSLNTAVNKLREALNDSADNPRFIQTIPRRGYRFIASVEVAADGASPSAEPKQVNSPVAEPSPAIPRESRNFALSDPHDLPDAPRGVIQFLFFAHSSHVSVFLRHLTGEIAMGGTGALADGSASKVDLHASHCDRTHRNPHSSISAFRRVFWISALAR